MYINTLCRVCRQFVTTPISADDLDIRSKQLTPFVILDLSGLKIGDMLTGVISTQQPYKFFICSLSGCL